MKILYKIYARLFAREAFRKLNYHILRFALSGLGILNYYNLKISGEEYFITNILPKFINNNPVFFDVGANIGNYSKLLSERFPYSFIHIFEPHPKNYNILKKQKFSSKTFINQLAISDENGVVKIYDYEDKDGSSHASLHKGVIEDIHKSKSVSHEVKKDTIDNYIRSNEIDQVDLLKIDIEGHELSALKGALDTIKSSKVKIIHFEFNEMNVESRVFFKDFYDLLEDYTLYRLLPKSLLKLGDYKPIHHEIFAYQNIIAIRDNSDNL